MVVAFADGEDPRQVERIAARFASFGWEMNPSNRTQALVPESAEPIDNDWGTAPGLAAKIGDAAVYIVPGVPRGGRAARWPLGGILPA